MPPLTGATADGLDDTGRAFFVPLIFMVIAITFAIACNFHKRTKAIMDGFTESKVGVVDAEGGLTVVVGGGERGEKGGDEKEIEDMHHDESLRR